MRSGRSIEFWKTIHFSVVYIPSASTIFFSLFCFFKKFSSFKNVAFIPLPSIYVLKIVSKCVQNDYVKKVTAILSFFLLEFYVYIDTMVHKMRKTSKSVTHFFSFSFFNFFPTTQFFNEWRILFLPSVVFFFRCIFV